MGAVAHHEADAVIGDDGSHGLDLDLDGDGRERRLGVAGDVGQRLLHDPVHDGLDLSGQAALVIEPDHEPTRHGIPDRRLRSSAKRRHGRDQADVVEHGGTQVEGELADLVEGLGHELSNLTGSLPDLSEIAPVLREGPVDETQAEQHGRERLADLVVQVTGHPRSLGLLGFDDQGQDLPLGPSPLLGSRELGHGHGAVVLSGNEQRGLDGACGERRQRDHELFVVGVELPAADLLGQVEVPVPAPGDTDRNTEEGPHGRVVVRKPA